MRSRQLHKKKDNQFNHYPSYAISYILFHSIPTYLDGKDNEQIENNCTHLNILSKLISSSYLKSSEWYNCPLFG